MVKNKKNIQSVKRSVIDRLMLSSKITCEELFKKYTSSYDGLSELQVEKNKEEYGENIVSKSKESSKIIIFIKSFINPFTLILFVLVVISFITDVILVPLKEKDYTTIVIILSMVLMSGILRFIQESRSNEAAEKLSQMIEVTTCVQRKKSGREEIPLGEIVVGDIIHFSAGDMISADMRILYAKDLFVSQASLTGESEPIEKFKDDESNSVNLVERANLIFLGSTVVSGSATAIVLAVGDETMFGSIAEEVNKKTEKTGFEIGINKVSWVLIRFMLIMVPIVFFINGITKGDWLNALMFAVSIAVGLTPEMLPMITTTCLAKGALSMSKKQVIVKDLNAIQNFGSMNILCTDKTGTLTQDKVVLQYNLDVMGNENKRVLRHAFLNSYYQTGLKNLMDVSIIERSEEKGITEEVMDRFVKVDEIPFDFERRRMSVVVCDQKNKTQLITKGAVEEIIEVSSFVEYANQVVPMNDDIKQKIFKVVNNLNASGMRVIAVAQKSNPDVVGHFGIKDEADMVLIGYLAFLDPPKENCKQAINRLVEYGVEVKVLTGDNDLVTRSICSQVGLDVSQMILGNEIDAMNDTQLLQATKKTNVFAKLSPLQKARIVKALRQDGNVVGFLGDGINDAPAMSVSDIGISVDTAVDIAKESSNIVLLEKDLMILEEGVIEGRKTYANMIKYIKMTASSNFGNMFSVLIASAFLPFLPMSAVQLIFLNLVYDTSCIAIPWDNVDIKFLKKPRNWDANRVVSFMKWFGPVSSIFDVITYFFLYFVICPSVTGGQLFHEISNIETKTLYIAVFQTGWLLESIWTQTLVVHMIRSEKTPFLQTQPSKFLLLFTMISIAFISITPYTEIGSMLKTEKMPFFYFIGLIAIVLGYILLSTKIKKKYIRRYGSLL